MKCWFDYLLGKDTTPKVEEELINNKSKQPRSHPTTMETSETTPSNLIRELVCLDQPLSKIVNDHSETSWTQVLQVCREILLCGENSTNQLVERKIIVQQILHPNEQPTPDIELDTSIKDEIEAVITRLRRAGLDNSVIEKICSNSNSNVIKLISNNKTKYNNGKKICQKWTQEEDRLLWMLRIEEKLEWDVITSLIRNHSENACKHRINGMMSSDDVQNSNLGEEEEDEEEEEEQMSTDRSSPTIQARITNRSSRVSNGEATSPISATTRGWKWTSAEEKLLWESMIVQNLDWNTILPLFPNRSESSVKAKLWDLKKKHACAAPKSSHPPEKLINRMRPITGDQDFNSEENEEPHVRQFWTDEEDELLWKLKTEKKLSWEDIVLHFEHRTQCSCQNRFARIFERFTTKQAPITKNPSKLQTRTTNEFSKVTNGEADQHSSANTKYLEWTPEDEELLWELRELHSLDWNEIYPSFPNREHTAVQTKYFELRNKYGNTASKPKALSKKSIRASSKQKHTKIVKHIKRPALESTEEKKLRECIEVDLTKGNLLYCFPNYAIGDLCARIESHPDFVEKSLTIGEKSLMTEQIHKGDTVEEIYSDYPLRPKSFVDLKYKEIAYTSLRKIKFKTREERLLYEAGMACLGSGPSKRSTKRSAGCDVDFDKLEELEQKASKIAPPPKPKIDPEIAAARTKARLEAQEKKKAERRRIYELARARRLAKPRDYSKKSSTPLVSLNLIKQLSESAEYFQTVTGDRQKVQEGAKRKRTQTVLFSPVIEVKLKTRARQAQKWELRRKLKEEARLKRELQRKSKKLTTKKKRKLNKKGRHSFDDEYEEFSDFDLRSVEPESQPEEEEEENHISPFDPPDINADTLVPLNDRHLFFKSIYEQEENVTLPELEFRHLREDETAKQAMTTNDGSILYDDELAADVVGSHRKCYRDMPISFPQYSTTPTSSSNGSTNINYANSVKIRFFLYPQHCELFVLAEPKDNELDPVHEIIKVFMIHYALYFDYSSTIKTYINELCHKLELAIEANDFSEFMYVIDTWNTLMLELSPNEKAVSRIMETGDDINAGARSLLNESEIRQVRNEDLNLEMFYNEICFESISPVYEPIQGEIEVIEDDIDADISIGKIEPPQNKSPQEREMNFIKPLHYNSDLFKRLREKTSLSRYSIQQILVRVYSRIVSTDSRKLRSYKAFTAEVYGELLPSFTSEVLEKVQLKPTQRFYDLGSGVGNTTLQAALEFGACCSGGCEIMDHASNLTTLQENLIQKHLAVFGLSPLNLKFALKQSFVNNEQVRQDCLASDVLIINNYLFDGDLNDAVGKLLYGIKPGTKIISLRNFISPRYRATFNTAFDFFSVEKHEMSDIMSVSWTANKVPYYISTVEETIRPEYLGREELLGELMLHAGMLSKSTTPSIGDVGDATRGIGRDYDEEDEGSESVHAMDVDGRGGDGVNGDGGELTPPTDHNSEPENDKN